MSPASILQLLYRPLAEFVYPPVCFVCQSMLRECERKICTDCWSRITPVHPGEDLFRDMESRLCSSGNVDGLISSFLFEKEGTLQSLIHELKYNGMTSLGVELGKKLGEKISTVIEIRQITGMVAVPLHPVKKRERGYNQSECICEGIHRVTGLKANHPALKRVKYTRSQTQLTIDERRGNVNDAFLVDPSQRRSFRDGAFLIVDDVITTGATIEACAKALIACGVKRVIACSIALADRSMLR